MAVSVNAGASRVFSTEPGTFSLRKCGNSLYIWYINARLDVSCFASCSGLTAQSVTYITRQTKRHDVALLDCLCKREGIISRYDIRNVRLAFFLLDFVLPCMVDSVFVIHHYLCHCDKMISTTL